MMGKSILKFTKLVCIIEIVLYKINEVNNMSNMALMINPFRFTSHVVGFQALSDWKISKDICKIFERQNLLKIFKKDFWSFKYLSIFFLS